MVFAVIAKYVPEVLCVLFPDARDLAGTALALPAGLTEQDLSPRELVTYHLQGYSNSQIINHYVGSKNLTGGIISMRRQRWYQANGLVIGADLHDGSKYLKRASDSWSNNNFFFRRIGDIDMQALSYTRPADQASQNYHASPAPAPISLPEPQDVPAWFRDGMAAEGYAIPPFQVWLRANPLIFARWPHLRQPLAHTGSAPALTAPPAAQPANRNLAASYAGAGPPYPIYYAVKPRLPTDEEDALDATPSEVERELEQRKRRVAAYRAAGRHVDEDY